MTIIQSRLKLCGYVLNATMTGIVLGPRSSGKGSEEMSYNWKLNGNEVVSDIGAVMCKEVFSKEVGMLLANAPKLAEVLSELLDACPTSCEDRRLIDAQKSAELLLFEVDYRDSDDLRASVLRDSE